MVELESEWQALRLQNPSPKSCTASSPGTPPAPGGLSTPRFLPQVLHLLSLSVVGNAVLTLGAVGCCNGDLSEQRQRVAEAPGLPLAKPLTSSENGHTSARIRHLLLSTPIRDQRLYLTSLSHHLNIALTSHFSFQKGKSTLSLSLM